MELKIEEEDANIDSDNFSDGNEKLFMITFNVDIIEIFFNCNVLPKIMQILTQILNLSRQNVIKKDNDFKQKKNRKLVNIK